MWVQSTRIRLWLEILFVVCVPVVLLRLPLHVRDHSVNWLFILFMGVFILRALVLLRFARLLLKRFHARYIAVPEGTLRTTKANRALLFTSLLVLFLVLEIVFMFVPQTQDLYKMGLANKVWNLYYREPENEKGFRDKPLAGRIHNGKQRIFFLGDSYTYGNGIRHSGERFPDMVYAQMDTSRFEAFNLGRGNSDTRDEFVRLLSFGLKPDYLLLQYYHNDIEKAGARHGHFNTSQTGYQSRKPSWAKKAGSFLAFLPIRSSFFLNYVAFNSAGLFFRGGGESYKDCLREAYADTACVREHLADLESIIRYSETNGVKLYVLFIPDARDIAFTQSLFDQHITPYLQSRGVPCITVDKAFRGYKASELVINRVNAHTNPVANALIAGEVLRAIPGIRR